MKQDDVVRSGEQEGDVYQVRDGEVPIKRQYIKPVRIQTKPQQQGEEASTTSNDNEKVGEKRARDEEGAAVDQSKQESKKKKRGMNRGKDRPVEKFEKKGLVPNQEGQVNFLSHELKVKLRKKQYQFKRANEAVKEARKFMEQNRATKNNNTNNAATPKNDAPAASSSAETPAPTETTHHNKNEPRIIEDEQDRPADSYVETKLKPEEKKKVDFKDKLILAPLTTVGNLPFRRICKQFGVDITVGEMAMGYNIVQGEPQEWALLRRHKSEDVFGVQIACNFPDLAAKCCELIEENCSVDFIDLNCGCPIDLVCKKQMGAGLLCRQNKLEEIVRTMAATLSIPFTVKTRTGESFEKRIAHQLYPRLEAAGASALILHGRTKQQRYTKEADWSYIKACAETVSIPVIGNGDVFSYLDFETHTRDHGVSSVMIGRGALIKPWLFTEIKERRHWDISATERLEILKDYARYGLDHWGADERGVETTRRFLLEWMSFLYRYVPVGLLEVLPQKLNQRPPSYFGRNELETLMASPSVEDWIKLSEMVLRPAPPGFKFVPKHKSNAYPSETQG